MELNSKIYVAGHAGMVGSAVVSKLKELGFTNVITRSKSELDLTIQSEVDNFFKLEKPEYVFHAAGKTGGIYANDNYRADFIYENLMMSVNVIKSAYDYEVRRLIYFGCSSIYPKDLSHPIKEEELLTGELEHTSEPFAVAKIAAMKLCESFNLQYGSDFLTVVPTNLYGAGQSFEPLNTVVIPAFIRRCHEAKISGQESVRLWGSGETMRDFMSSNDLAEAAVFLMRNYQGNETFNVGTGIEHPIKEVAELIKEVVGFEGDIVCDETKPEGVKRKSQCLDKIHSIGWKAKTNLKDGLKIVYKDFLERLERGEF